MAGVRRAFFWVTTGRYLVMLVNLAVAFIMARLIGPAAFGVSVIGGAAYAIAEALRELGGGAYLIQQRELTLEKIRTSVTTSVIASIAISLCMYFSADLVAWFYDLPEVKRYIQVAAIAYVLGPFIFPVFALMSREMAFRSFALVNVSMAVSGGTTGIVLAHLGFGYMSLAWASVASTVVGSALCFFLYSNRSIYHPTLSDWRSVLGFGAFDSATALIAAVGEHAPYLVIGRVLDSASVGIAQRSVLLSVFPERVILAGVSAVALPTFSRSVRENSDTRATYLNAIELITVIHWPCLILLAALSTPVVKLVLGTQWLEAASLVKVLCFAAAFSFPFALQYPILVAVGAVRSLPFLVAGQAMLNTAAIAIVANQGLFAIAWCLVGVVPLNALVAVTIVRRQLRFGWCEFFAAPRRSIVVSVLSAIGPALLIWNEGSSDLALAMALIAVLLFAIGWAAGLILTQHPLLHELLRALRRPKALYQPTS